MTQLARRPGLPDPLTSRNAHRTFPASSGLPVAEQNTSPRAPTVDLRGGSSVRLGFRV
ncbi:hypothetical protein [Actinomadura geliboluensis]|uniref:hypothetical protein n=1 Tax=Actinomadura geliboluensis TaxID=882440 RepID=UPI00367BBE67